MGQSLSSPAAIMGGFSALKLRTFLRQNNLGLDDGSFRLSMGRKARQG